jgi:hypothetical protein
MKTSQRGKLVHVQNALILFLNYSTGIKDPEELNKYRPHLFDCGTTEGWPSQLHAP